MVAASHIALAQTAPPTRIRGTITSVEGPVMSVTSREGEKLAITLNEPLAVLTVKPVELVSIAPGSYIGVATRTGTGGSLNAIEVLVFPESMRGAGEGHYAWDLEPGSMMTNGTVNGVMEASAGRDLNVSYKGESKKITVAPGAPVVTFAAAERADVKAGAPVFLSATKDAEGKFAASRVVVGTNGVAPPM
jgi:hypothetical protein